MTLNKFFLLTLVFICLFNFSLNLTRKNEIESKKVIKKDDQENSLKTNLNSDNSKLKTQPDTKTRTNTEKKSKIIEDGDIAAITVGKAKPFRTTEPCGRCPRGFECSSKEGICVPRRTTPAAVNENKVNNSKDSLRTTEKEKQRGGDDCGGCPRGHVCSGIKEKVCVRTRKTSDVSGDKVENTKDSLRKMENEKEKTDQWSKNG
jgi:hypothetical protein